MLTKDTGRGLGDLLLADLFLMPGYLMPKHVHTAYVIPDLR